MNYCIIIFKPSLLFSGFPGTLLSNTQTNSTQYNPTQSNTIQYNPTQSNTIHKRHVVLANDFVEGYPGGRGHHERHHRDVRLV